MNIEDKNIITELGIILKQATFHNSNNAAVLDSIEDFINRINSIIEIEGMLRINLVGDIFYLNNTLVKYSTEASAITDHIIIEFKKRGATCAFRYKREVIVNRKHWANSTEAQGETCL